MRQENNATFRTLNYLGSKLRLLDFIEDQVQQITPIGAGVCDLFAGSGCVSYRLSLKYSICACDIQYYSKIICSALLNQTPIPSELIASFLNDIETNAQILLKNAFAPLIQLENSAIGNRDLGTLTDIIEKGSVEVFRLSKLSSSISSIQKQVIKNLTDMGIIGNESIISRYYGGVYFSYLQATQIDAILSSIRKIDNIAAKNVFVAALLSTASDIACTIGKHFAQPIKARDSKGNIKSLVYNKATKDKTIDVLKLYQEWLQKYLTLDRSQYPHMIVQGDYMNCLKSLPSDIRTIYADPPYTRDHYSRFYHVLETIAIGDSPEISRVTTNGITHFSNGIYRNDRYQSPFCIKSKALAAFNDMFLTISKAQRQLILSYSPYDESKTTHPRVVTIQQLISLANKYFKQVEVVSAGHFTHNKLNSAEHFLASSDEAEVLIICTN